MQISFIFLSILLCSEASAAGPLRRGQRYKYPTPRLARIKLTESRWRRQDAAKLSLNATSGVVSGTDARQTALGSAVDSNTIPVFDFYPSSTVPVGSTGKVAVPSTTAAASTTAAPSTTAAASGTQPAASGAPPSSIDSATIPNFDFHPSSTVPVGSTATDAAPSTTTVANETRPAVPSSTSSAGDSGTIPVFDFFPSSTVPVGSSGAGKTQPATEPAAEPVSSSAVSPSATPSTVESSTIPSFDFFPSSTVAVDTPSNAPAATATSATLASSAQPVTATGKPDNQVPTVITSPPPTSTTVAPDVLASNLADARQYNELFSNMDGQSACSTGQVACINGNIGKCSNAGVFEIIPCVNGLACYALPMNTTTGVQIGCYDNTSAKNILTGGSGNGAVPSPSDSAGSQVTVTMQPTQTVISQVTVTSASPTAVVTEPTMSVVTQTVERTIDHTVEHTTTVMVTVTPSSTVEVPPENPTTLVTVTRSDAAPSPSTTDPAVLTPTTLVVIPITRTRGN